jgi:DNA-binding MarR family transcriptional regulator
MTSCGPAVYKPPSFTLLVRIAAAGPAPITQLAEGLVIDRTTLTRNLKPLEKQGLIQVATGEDQRLRLVSLTEPGYQALAKALPLWEQAQAQAVNTVGAERFKAFPIEACFLARIPLRQASSASVPL